MMNQNAELSPEEREELSSMKKWLRSLSEEQLVQAMTFSFHPDQNRHQHRHQNRKSHTATNVNVGITGICHEYDLLVEMLSLQAPPCTPIHPRAMGVDVKRASLHTRSTAATDGRSDARRILRDRIVRPRLFQFIERKRKNSSFFHDHDHGGLLDSDSDLDYNLVAADLNNMPPEIACMIMKERNSVKSKEKDKKQQKEKKNKQKGANQNGGSDGSGRKYYDVIARKFVTSCGDILSVGSIQSMRDADEILLLSTHVQSGCRQIHQSSTATTSESKNNNRKTSNNISSNSSHHNQRTITCTFQKDERLSQEGQVCGWRHKCRGIRDSTDILEILRIASRGRCFTRAPAASADDSGTCTSCESTFIAPWFEPTKDWFSLPLYIASRFEVALWNSFHASTTSSKVIVTKQEPPPLHTTTIIEKSFESLKAIERHRLLISASGFALKKVLAADVECPSPNTCATRDLFLYELLSETKAETLDNAILPTEYYGCLHLIPLLKMGTRSDKFRLYMIEHCEEEIAKFAEMELLSKTSSTSPSPSPSFNPNLKPSKKKKKKKRKKRPSHQRKMNNALGSINENKIDEPSSIQRDELSSTTSSLPIPVPGMSIPDEEKNKTTVMVLGILDEIYNKVFTQLGFGNEFESDDGYQVTKHSKTDHNSPSKKNEKYVLRKSKKQQQQYCIARSENKNDYSLANVSQLLENQMTMKRNNLSQVQQGTTTVSNRTIWDFMSSSDELRMDEQSSMAFGISQHQQPQNFQRSHHRPHFTSLFTPPPPMHQMQHLDRTYEHSLFNSPGIVGLPLHSEDGLLHDLRSYEYRQSSLISDLFDDSDKDNEANFASSTAASIASSILDNDDVSSDEELNDSGAIFEPIFEENNHNNLAEEETESHESNESSSKDVKDSAHQMPPRPNPSFVESSSSSISDESGKSKLDNGVEETNDSETSESDHILAEAPDTPPPQLSPIVVSLADFGELRKRAHLRSVSDIGEDTTFPDDIGKRSPGKSNLTMHRSYSREDLRLPSTRDDYYGRHKMPPCSSRTVDFSTLSYRNAAMKNPHSRRAKSVTSQDLADYTKRRTSHARKATPNNKPFTKISFTKEVIIGGHLNVCAQSESALDDNDDSSHWNVIPRIAFDENDNATATRDGATTISSMPAPHDLDELMHLREEKNAFQDMYLTMAAEVSKLRNMLALERINSSLTLPQPAPAFTNAGSTKSFDPECMPPFFHARQKGMLRKYAAMSDAGLNDVQMSEDGTETMQGSVIMADGKRLISRTNSINNRVQNFVGGKAPGAGSDVASLEYDNTTYSAMAPSYSIHKNSGPEVLNIFQSRLSRDIDNFLADITGKLRKQEKRKLLAIKRLSLLVTTIWPRAQVKMYGSHQCDLRLPSSDLDFVICLPNVHRNAPADTPGALEGRNAINESNQKLFARKLKSESWIELKSIKVIERTVIPVIKVTTKDSRSKSLQLDISFDSPEHHGLEAVGMVKKIMESFPMLRPIVLVLKQFLLDKGLLTAYTGGISSYCLFLMVTRYLQEQDVQLLDAGSLVMGCLDFYGNVFDPRLVGISVSNGGQYFQRPHYQTNRSPIQENPNHPPRRNSFQHQKEPNVTFDPSRPFTFDPLFVEDPTSPGNNVGRNSFRINQVQRVFSDAHRALVASLEWDMDMNSGMEFQDDEDAYPLLKCLLQNEDSCY